jgi:protein involved in polysaccharide export with SLBB domain
MDRSWRTQCGRLLVWGIAVVSTGVSIGCASFANPTAPDAIPVHRLPPEVFGRPREEERTIPLTLLRQEPPKNYLFDAGDVLGVFIEGILGQRGEVPPVIPQAVYSTTGTPPPPALGFPIPVQENGTINLPLLEPINVKGMTAVEVQALVTKEYVDRRLVAAGARVLVSLARQRTYHVTVIRQDQGGLIVSAAGQFVNSRRGTGVPLDLNAYENDVLTALARSGGLPGLDATNTVVVQRGGTGRTVGVGTPVGEVAAATTQVRIPMRMRANEPLPFKPEDTILRNGDIIFIESRDTEVYYTGGLLPVAELILPRDYDLDVLEAVTQCRGPLFNGAVNFNNLSGGVLSPGIGNPSPSLLNVIRRTPGCGQITIRVDLNRCAQNPRERILVQPGDFLILQEAPSESLTRYVTQTFRFNIFATLLRQRDLTITTTPTVP